MIEHLFNEYGLRFNVTTLYGEQWLSIGNQLFSLKDQRLFHHSDLKKLFDYSSWFIQRGDSRVASIVPTKKGKLSTKINGGNFVLLAIPKFNSGGPPTGESLAIFHKKGGEALKNEKNKNDLFTHWPSFWAKRIDDLSVHWNEVEQKLSRSEYEKLFLRVYPYFSGRAENAIQYLTDLMIDEPVLDIPVICHHRFSAKSWGESPLFVNTPDQWVIDHPARDLAEWVRDVVIRSDHSPTEIYPFIDAYLRQNSLSEAGLGFVFARLLFPIFFIENGELNFDYHEELRSSQMGLKALLDKLDKEERFLHSFGKRYLKNLPRVDWLAQKQQHSV